MKRRKRFVLQYQRLEDRRCLAPVAFDIGTLVSRSEIPSAGSAVAADLDGDGDLDIVSAGEESILTQNLVEVRIAWSENLDGQGTFGRPQFIAKTHQPITSLAALDIDGDADIDVVATLDELVFGASGPASIVAYENQGGTFADGVILVPNAQLAGAFDVDADGDTDLVSIERRAALYWYANQGTGVFLRQSHISVRENFPRRVEPGDIDADGDLDVVVLGEGSISWSQNSNGVFGRADLVLDSFRGYPEAALADFDKDGDLDLVAVSNPTRRLVWFEFNAGTFGPAQGIADLTGRQSYAPVAALDVDGDQDQDIVVAANGNRIIWFENVDATGDFVERDALVSEKSDIASLLPIDLNGDDLVDLLMTARLADLVAWYENDAALSFQEHRVTFAGSRPAALTLVDVDHDDDLDLLSACYGEFLMWKNNEGEFQDPTILNGDAVLGYAVESMDIDGDGHLDVVTGDFNGTIKWQRNLDGQGNFGASQLIAQDLDGLEAIAIGDADGDGDVDVFSASRFDGTVAWYENTDGLGTFGPLRAIVTSAGHVRDISLGDLDGDGDLDVLSTAWQTPAFPDVVTSVAWYPNRDGRGDFGEAQALSTVRQAGEVLARDMDQDGDNDIVYTASGFGGVFLLENLNGLGMFSAEQPIAPLESLEKLEIVDLDGDGDSDIIATRGDSILWIENLGSNQFALQPAISDTLYGGGAVVAGDIDRDGRMDLVYSSDDTDEILYRRNRGVPGDANGDNVFDSSDLTQAFMANEYEDTLTGNSTLADGDFNGDGDFTTEDLVYAFSYGLYMG